MAGNRYIWKYAKNVHEQDNPNATKRNHWAGLNKSVSHDGDVRPTGNGYAPFTDDPVITQKKVKATKSNPLGIKWDVKHNYNYPYVVSVHQFGLNIPSNAYIYKVTFRVCMKVDKGVTAKAPRGIANIYGQAYHARTNTGGNTGWMHGYYHMQPNVKLSTSWKEVDYVLTEGIIAEAGLTPKLLNDAITGMDLNFTECGNNDGNIYIKWAGIAVEYDVPDNKVFFNIPTTPENPYYVKTGDEFSIAAIHTNDTNASDVDQHYPVKVPPFGFDISNNRGVTDVWIVPAYRHAQNWLWFDVKAHILGLNEIDVGGAKFWMYSLYGDGDDYYVVRITPTVLRKAINGCIQVNAHVWDEDGIVTFDVTYAEGYPNPPLKFDFNGQLSSMGVTVRSIGSDSISFNIPPRTECDVCFDVCAVPVMSGEFTFKLVDDDGDVYRQNYNVLPPYEYKFCNTPDADDETFDIKFVQGRASFTLDRFVTQTELGMYELDALFNEETMYMTDCNLTVSKFDELDYVGCVPLMQSHFDPKSDFTDTLLNETYKNKVYMGKKGVIDETITLNLRVPPRDVTTLQGLVEMDKPVPINTCHTAFEGDALNHRGWVELYGVKDVEKTNPNFYKISLDVKYLTHNIAYKFDILRHGKIVETSIPSLFSEVLSFDEPLSEGLDYDDDDGTVVSSDFFEVDTDGTYRYIDEDGEEVVESNYTFVNNTVSTVYDDTVEESELEPDGGEIVDIYNGDFSNLFNLGEGQHLRLTSHKVLSPNVKISCNWKSNKRDTEPNIQNNSMRRVFRIRDALNKDDILFEYTYYDFNFSQTDFVKAHVTSTYTGVDGNIRTLFNQEIAVKTFPDTDEDGEVDLGLWYGSSVVFELNGNKLAVTDIGFNGRELYGTCDLKTGSYIFECEFTNLLTQSYLEDAFLYCDMEVMDTILQTNYAETYSNLVVSPFPVIGKKVLFTRQSEEGTIYYLYDDNAPFKYLLEPYYQYHCGVDLKSREGISIYNLENSYSIFYMQNGLLRIGFNRVDGEVYLSKYDPNSQEYITTNILKLNANVKFDRGIFNDDKIEILADTMIFTMWRGHPYIMVNHPNNDIEIKTVFTRVFGETSSTGMPSWINLMNEDNLLPACVGGADISSSCINTVVNRENLVESHTITCVPSGEIVQDADITFSYLFDGEANPSVASMVKYLINGNEIVGDNYKFNEAGVFDICAVYIGDDLNHYAVSPIIHAEIIAKTVFPPIDPGSTKPEDPYMQTWTPGITGKFELTCDTPKNKMFRYKDGGQIIFTLTRGGIPISGKVVEIGEPSGMHSHTTNANGQVVVTNDYEVVPRDEVFYIQATFNDQVDEDLDKQTLYRLTIPIHIYKQKSTLEMKSAGVIHKGQYATFQLNVNGTPRSGYPLTFSMNGGMKITHHTNNSGQVKIKMVNTGLYKFKVDFAGTKYKTVATLKESVKVLK